jgi:alpha-ketoglutarate-dependent taurine dioxygenase|tara:strand:+ start:8068 stop:8928 length:861 start_codon:yes stop_codon:yes gene_type:complete
MNITIEPTDATLGAVIKHVDLSQLDDGTWADIEGAFLEFGVLIFPGQHLSTDAQVAFAERFGKIEYLSPEHKIVPISNQRADGSVLEEHQHGMRILRGNEGWHTDSSYMPIAAKASVLSARVIPAEGGQTEWADTRAAYDALDDAMREKITGMTAFHSLYYSQGRVGHKVAVGAGYGFHDEEPPLRPLVKEHPATGRPSLFIGRHAYGISGLGPEESEKLLDELVSFACQTPRTYMHTWEPGDAVVWDNRCLLHRARPYDYREPRVLYHTRVSGDPATEAGLQYLE